VCDNKTCPLRAAIREEVRRALGELNSPRSPLGNQGQANLEKTRRGSSLPGLAAVETAAAPEGGQPMKLLLSIRETAEVLSLSEGTVWALVRTGELNSCKVGRCRRLIAVSVAEYVQRLQEEGVGGG